MNPDSLYSHTQKSTNIINLGYLFFVTSGNLLLKGMPDWRYSLDKIKYELVSPLPLQKGFLGATERPPPRPQSSVKSLNQTYTPTLMLCAFLSVNAPETLNTLP